MAARKPALSARDLCILALLAALLFLQEELLTFLPNVQLTVFLILLYAKVVGFGYTAAVISVYLLLDSLFMGAVNPPAMLCLWIGWMLIPLAAVTVLRKTEDKLYLACAGAALAFVFSWCQVLPGCRILGISPRAYLAADLLYEIILAASSFLSILLLFDPLYRLLLRLWNNR